MNILIKLEHDLPPTPPALTPYKPKTKLEEPPAYRPFKIDRSRIIVKTSCDDVDDPKKKSPSSSEEDSLRVLG
jgi:hypothetical protein